MRLKTARYFFYYMKRFNTREEAERYVDTLPLLTLRDMLIECLAEPEPLRLKPIAISEEEFRAHFRLTGVREDGKLETRGRPRKEK